VTNTNFQLNFGSIRKLLGLKQIAVADAAGLNHQRLCWLMVGYRDPTVGEDRTLRAVLLCVALRRRVELEAAIEWLKGNKPQTWEVDPRKDARDLVESSASPSP
jgi:hypothetical protein